MKRIGLRILGFGLALSSMTLPAQEVSIVKDDITMYHTSVTEDEEVYVGNFTFHNATSYWTTITADVYKIFPQDGRPYYVAFFKNRTYLLMEYSNSSHGDKQYFLSVDGEKYYAVLEYINN